MKHSCLRFRPKCAMEVRPRTPMQHRQFAISVGCSTLYRARPGRAPVFFRRFRMIKLNKPSPCAACCWPAAPHATAWPVLAQDVLQRAPEIATGYAEKAGWAARKYMVAAANPLAVEAGYEMLKQGGTAIDAAIATQLVLTLVEPQVLGHRRRRLPGVLRRQEGAGLRRPRNRALEGRRAPVPESRRHAAVAHEGIVGGRSTGAPGVLRMLELAHKPARQAALENPVRAGDPPVRAVSRSARA
jgi:hypothetical protein